ncbi:MAG: hypothetical protein U1E71_06625 [Ramlibacter sp.]
MRHFASRWSVGPAAGLGATWSHNHAHRVIGAGASHLPAAWWPSVMGKVSLFINTGIVGYDPNAGGICNVANTWCAPTLSRLSIPTCTHRRGRPPAAWTP